MTNSLPFLTSNYLSLGSPHLSCILSTPQAPPLCGGGIGISSPVSSHDCLVNKPPSAADLNISECGSHRNTLTLWLSTSASKGQPQRCAGRNFKEADVQRSSYDNGNWLRNYSLSSEGSTVQLVKNKKYLLYDWMISKIYFVCGGKKENWVIK